MRLSGPRPPVHPDRTLHIGSCYFTSPPSEGGLVVPTGICHNVIYPTLSGAAVELRQSGDFREKKVTTFQAG